MNKSKWIMDDTMKKKKSLHLISRLVTVLLVLCVIPSGVLAFENNQNFGPGQKISDENFTEAKADILDSISKQITELQSLYTSVSKASNISELQNALFAHSQANGCVSDRMGRGHSGMHHGAGRISGFFNLEQVENVTDNNYSVVQTEMVNSLGNMTVKLKEKVNSTTDENRTAILNEKITELEGFSANLSGASNAAELQNVVLTYMKIQAMDSIDKKIEHIETRVSESNNETNDVEENVTELNNRITELNSLKDKINATGSIKEFREIMLSSYGMPEGDNRMCFGHDKMHHRGDLSMRPGRMSENDDAGNNPKI